MRIVGVIAAMAAAGLLASGLAMADTAAEQRSKAMKAMGSHMKAMGAVAKGEKPFDEAAMKSHAEGVVMTSQSILKLFPEGSGGGKSRAKPEIWQDWPAFEKAAADFQAAAPMLVDAAATGDAAKLGAALKAVGKTCGGCHKPFRKPET